MWIQVCDINTVETVCVCTRVMVNGFYIINRTIRAASD